MSDAFIPFDHRKSIIAFLEGRAEKYEVIANRKEEARALRIAAQDIKAEFDIEQGQDNIVTPVQAIALAVCERFGGVALDELLGNSQAQPAVRARFAAIWIAKKRLDWSNECLGAAENFGRDGSSISHAIKRADEIRQTDTEFKRVIEELTVRDLRCENCQHPFVVA